MAIFAVVLVLALLWLALLYLGIPLGIIGCCIGAYLFRTSTEETGRRDGVIIAGVSVAVVVASLVGNASDKDAPLHAWLNGESQPQINQQGDD